MQCVEPKTTHIKKKTVGQVSPVDRLFIIERTRLLLGCLLLSSCLLRRSLGGCLLRGSLRCCFLSHRSRPSRECLVLSLPRLPGALNGRGRPPRTLNWSTLTSSFAPLNECLVLPPNTRSCEQTSHEANGMKTAEPCNPFLDTFRTISTGGRKERRDFVVIIDPIRHQMHHASRARRSSQAVLEGPPCRSSVTRSSLVIKVLRCTSSPRLNVQTARP